ncbi:hypothetical protein D9M72_572020 [compost metagenome]
MKSNISSALPSEHAAIRRNWLWLRGVLAVVAAAAGTAATLAGVARVASFMQGLHELVGGCTHGGPVLSGPGEQGARAAVRLATCGAEYSGKRAGTKNHIFSS